MKLIKINWNEIRTNVKYICIIFNIFRLINWHGILTVCSDWFTLSLISGSNLIYLIFMLYLFEYYFTFVNLLYYVFYFHIKLTIYISYLFQQLLKMTPSMSQGLEEKKYISGKTVVEWILVSEVIEILHRHSYTLYYLL